ADAFASHGSAVRNVTAWTRSSSIRPRCRSEARMVQNRTDLRRSVFRANLFSPLCLCGPPSIRATIGFSLRQRRQNPNAPLVGAGVWNGQEAVRRKSFLLDHERGPRVALRRGRNLRVGGGHHRSRDRTLAGLRLRGDELPSRGTEGHHRPERARAAGTDPERQRSARAVRWWWGGRRPRPPPPRAPP